MSAKENKAIVKRWNEEIWNKGNVDIIDELGAANYINRSNNYDRAAFRQWAVGFRAAFSEGGITIEDMIAEGDKVAVRWTMHGTHTGEFMGISATGKQLTGTGISIYRIANGKIVEDWSNSDELGMMQQLGVIPPMGEGGE
jgi:steroid delta-isomerase-like uncharacterized protein